MYLPKNSILFEIITRTKISLWFVEWFPENGMFMMAKGSAERSEEAFGFSAERSVVRPNLKMKVRSYTTKNIEILGSFSNFHRDKTFIYLLKMTTKISFSLEALLPKYV